MSKHIRIIYYIGATTSHLTHALPLYKKAGGEFIVTSASAKRELIKLNLPVTCIDAPSEYVRIQVDRIREKAGRTPHRFRLGKNLKKTFLYIENAADVVLFYELFEFTKHTKLEKPLTIFMSHGNMLKNYMVMYPKRLELVRSYDYMAGLSPYLMNKHIEAGVPKKKLLPIGTARNDTMVDLRTREVTPSHTIINQLGFSQHQKLACYVPTYWGSSSVHNTGKEIIRNFPEDISLIIRLHPQTPAAIVREYTALIAAHANRSIILNPPNISLEDILAASNVVIGDVSSVILDAVLLKKPLIFAEDSQQPEPRDSYEAIREIYDASTKITKDNVVHISDIIRYSLAHSVDENAREKSITRAFFNSNGDSVSEIIRQIYSALAQSR